MAFRIMDLICTLLVLAFLAVVHFGANEIIINYKEHELTSAHIFVSAYNLTCRDADQYNFDTNEFREAMEINYDFLSAVETIYWKALSQKEYDASFQYLLEERNDKICSLIDTNRTVISRIE